MRQRLYPFSAIVEQSALKTALLLNAVDPSIGGVLIRGHKGTGKSTAARALAQLLPSIEVVEDCPFNSDPKDPFSPTGLEWEGSRRRPAKPVLCSIPFIELPLNATEDRLVGSLHIEKALQKGERRFEPGLLAAANRGILYVDEANLLPDHLVDMLLDSAASGINVIEREGISFIHPAHFMLIGTMNPEEGELRPQFLDRFGLCVAVESVVDLEAGGLDDMAESIQVPGAAAAGSVLFSFLGKKHADTVFEPDKGIASAGVDLEDLLIKKRRSRRKSRNVIVSSTGRYIKAEAIRPGDKDFGIAIDAALRQAALRSAREGVQAEANAPVQEGDLRKKHLANPSQNLIVFAVDSSGSMGSRAGVPMRAAKGAALAILHKAHQSRSQVAMVAFGGQNATLVQPPTSSVAFAESTLEHLPAGGATPFAESLFLAWQLIRSERIKNPVVRPILVIISDGDANVPISPEAEPLEELESLAEKIAQDRVAAVFIDAAEKQKGESQMQRLAVRMQASCITISDFSASAILEAVLSHGGLQ
jgi:Mg-chelatase subunit ChlD